MNYKHYYPGKTKESTFANSKTNLFCRIFYNEFMYMGVRERGMAFFVESCKGKPLKITFLDQELNVNLPNTYIPIAKY